MANKLDGFRVAILATEGFEQSELIEPRKALQDQGAEVLVVAPKEDQIRGWQHDHWGDSVNVDMTLSEADADSFDALMLPGGVMNPDHLRINDEAVSFTKKFVTSGKPIAAICHGPWTLIEAGGVKGKRMTSYSSIQTDLKNAGAEWVDQETVRDGALLTSRNPNDIPAFNEAMISLFSDSFSKGARLGQDLEARPEA